MSSRPRPSEDAELPDLVLPVEKEDHHRGPIGAKYSLVEYGDYECEHCEHLEPIITELVRELGDDLCYAFRNFPETKEHPHAQAAAEAAEAADEQGKFWLMHERLFQHRTELSADLIHRLARELPLDLPTYERDIASGAPARRVAEDRESGEEAGVEETPTLFVNGRLHAGSYEFLPLLEAIRGSK